MVSAPAQFTTYDGTLSGAINGSNRRYAFIPDPLTVFYSGLNAPDALLFRNGQLLDTAYGDYTAGNGSFTLTSAEGIITAELYRTYLTRFRLSDGSLVASSDSLLRITQTPPPGPLMLFRNGQLLTAGSDFAVSLPYLALINGVVTVTGDSWQVVMSTGGSAATTADGSIAGALDGSNPNFTLPFDPTRLMLFRNGQLLTSGVDYTRSGAALVMSAAHIPVSGDTLTGQLFTGTNPLQVTTNDGGLYREPVMAAVKILSFYNGILMTPPVDVTIGLNSVSLAQAPNAPDVVTVQAWTPVSSDVAPLNLSTQYTTLDGTIAGALDRHNKVYTLQDNGLITAIMLWWNGAFQTQNVDYTLSGNVITMLSAFPANEDILTAEVFSQ